MSMEGGEEKSAPRPNRAPNPDQTKGPRRRRESVRLATGLTTLQFEDELRGKPRTQTPRAGRTGAEVQPKRQAIAGQHIHAADAIPFSRALLREKVDCFWGSAGIVI